MSFIPTIERNRNLDEGNFWHYVAERVTVLSIEKLLEGYPYDHVKNVQFYTAFHPFISDYFKQYNSMASGLVDNEYEYCRLLCFWIGRKAVKLQDIIEEIYLATESHDMLPKSTAHRLMWLQNMSSESTIKLKEQRHTLADTVSLKACHIIMHTLTTSNSSTCEAGAKLVESIITQQKHNLLKKTQYREKYLTKMKTEQAVKMTLNEENSRKSSEHMKPSHQLPLLSGPGVAPLLTIAGKTAAYNVFSNDKQHLIKGSQQVLVHSIPSTITGTPPPPPKTPTPASKTPPKKHVSPLQPLPSGIPPPPPGIPPPQKKEQKIPKRTEQTNSKIQTKENDHWLGSYKTPGNTTVTLPIGAAPMFREMHIKNHKKAVQNQKAVETAGQLGIQGAPATTSSPHTTITEQREKNEKERIAQQYSSTLTGMIGLESATSKLQRSLRKHRKATAGGESTGMSSDGEYSDVPNEHGGSGGSRHSSPAPSEKSVEVETAVEVAVAVLVDAKNKTDTILHGVISQNNGTKPPTPASPIPPAIGSAPAAHATPRSVVAPKSVPVAGSTALPAEPAAAAPIPPAPGSTAAPVTPAAPTGSTPAAPVTTAVPTGSTPAAATASEAEAAAASEAAAIAAAAAMTTPSEIQGMLAML